SHNEESFVPKDAPPQAKSLVHSAGRLETLLCQPQHAGLATCCAATYSTGWQDTISCLPNKNSRAIRTVCRRLGKRISRVLGRCAIRGSGFPTQNTLTWKREESSRQMISRALAICAFCSP